MEIAIPPHTLHTPSSPLTLESLVPSVNYNSLYLWRGGTYANEELDPQLLVGYCWRIMGMTPQPTIFRDSARCRDAKFRVSTTHFVCKSGVITPIRQLRPLRSRGSEQMQ